MKKSIFLALVCAGSMFTATAQNTKTNNNNNTNNPSNPPTSTNTTNINGNTSSDMRQTTMTDYERMLQNQQKVEFRMQAIKTLGLSELQIKDFDPLYSGYMQKKNELAQKRIKLLNEYMEEVAENDSPSNEENDKEEFLEDYLELQVKEMELRKDYFDKMEDVITADNAFGFYLIEDMAANNYYMHLLEGKFAPFIVVQREAYSSNAPGMNSSNPSVTNRSIDSGNASNSNANRSTSTSPNAPSSPTPAPSSTNKANSNTNAPMPSNATNGNMNNNNYASTTAKTVDSQYRADIDTYSNWVRNTKANVGGNHQYTHDGLNNLVKAISALSMACNLTTDNAFTANKSKIIANATELQKDPKSNKHADLMRQSFTMAADMLKSVQEGCNQTASSTAVAQVAEAARKIDVNKTSNSQQQEIMAFFQKAQMAIDGMAGRMTWTGK